MEEGNFVEWLKKDGDRVRQGDDLFVLESDKSSETIAAIDAGVLHIPADAPGPGDKVQVGQVLGWLLAEGEHAPAGRAGPGKAEEALLTPDPVRAPQRGEGSKPEAQARERQAFTPRQTPITPDPSPQRGEGGKIEQGADAPRSPRGRKPISPRARKLARESKLDWSGLQGSGRNGRVRERDVLAALQTRPHGRVIPHTPTRRLIAARMLAGVTQAAPVTLTTKVSAANLVNLREQFRSVAPEEAPGYTDLILALAAKALPRHPLLQAQWREEGLFVPDSIDVAFAVDVQDGLLAPVVRSADKLTLRQVTARTRELIALARSGKLPAEQMRDATFTLTNLGMFGVDSFTPVINLPQCASLGVGRIVRDEITLSLTFDHRVIDGAPAARFLQTLGGCIEQPAPWLVP
jgi:pyruvate dehydrogenase E2 component (dihydrolipoamide acetyltransferase)